MNYSTSFGEKYKFLDSYKCLMLTAFRICHMKKNKTNRGLSISARKKIGVLYEFSTALNSEQLVVIECIYREYIL